MNTGELIRRCCLYYADRIAFSQGDRQLSYRQLNERINRLANALISMGLQKGDRVAIFSKNRPQIIETAFACYKAGLVTVPLNARLTMTEVMHMLTNSESSVLMLGREFVANIEKARAEASSGMSGVRHFIATANPGTDMTDYETLLVESRPEEPAIQVGLDDVASLNYTSGTTGVLKAAILTHRNRICMAQKQLLIPGIDVDRDAVIGHASPLTHGGYTMVLPVMLRGGRGVILPGFDVKELFRTIERERVTHLMLVPTMINMMLNHPDLKSHDLSSLRTILYAASPMPVERIRQALDAFGAVLIQCYGCTESSALITYLSKEDHLVDDDPKRMKRIASCGVPMMTCDVRVVTKAGTDIAPGEIGEIIERGDDTMMGYWRDPERTAETLKNGWLHTGDLATMDEDGYIYLVDRKNDMIISGGYNIYPSEIEEVLYRHPSVYEAAVIGVPDDLWGEAVKAVVVLKEDMPTTAEELIEHCKIDLASYKKPKIVDFVTKLPKNPSGKVVRRLLRERY